MPDPTDTETLAEVRLTDAEREALCLRRNCVRTYSADEARFSTLHALDCDDHRKAVERVIAARIVQARAGDEQVKDREFGNLRWMDGHQQGLKDGLAEARAGEGALRERVEAVLADGDHDAFCDQDDECECWRRRLRAALTTADPS